MADHLSNQFNPIIKMDTRPQQPQPDQLPRPRASRANQKKSIFPHKLWRMVNDPQLDSAIRWSDDGKSFLVFENPLRNMCLGKENNIFYTRQPKSFVRQLHLYGFRKINKNQFTHTYFQREQPELLKFIRRSYKSNSTSSTTTNSSDDSKISDRPNDDLDESEESLSSPSKGNPQQQPESYHHQLQLQEQQQSLEGAGAVMVVGEQSNNTQLFNDSAVNSSNHVNSQLGTNTTAPVHHLGGVTVYANNYDESCAPPLGWYESSYVDISYNYNDDSILTLYNNDIYPNTIDHNITL